MAKLMLCGVNEKSIVAKTILAMVACMCPTGGSTSEFGTSTVLFLAAKCSGMLCTALLIFDGIYGWDPHPHGLICQATDSVSPQPNRIR